LSLIEAVTIAAGLQEHIALVQKKVSARRCSSDVDGCALLVGIRS
jgi:hypothetical protein